MNSSKIVTALVIFFAANLLATMPARADTYTFFNLGSDDHYDTYGLDGSGAAVVLGFANAIPCPSTVSLPCYISYVKGVAVSESPTPPTLNYSPPTTPPSGPGCAGLPSFVTSSDVAFDFCTNGYEFFGIGNLVTDPTTGKEYRGVFTGPDFATDVFGGAPLTNPDGSLVSFSRAYVDEFGDLLWDSASAGEIIEAYNVTAHAPEPTTLTLLTTGVLATAAVIRKRRKS